MSILITDHDIVKARLVKGLRICGAPYAKSAQQSANPERPAHQPCQPAGHDRRMGKLILVQFRRSRLPRRLLDDGWWLESSRSRGRVIALPKRDAPVSST